MLSQSKNSTVIYSTGDIKKLVEKAKEGDKHAFELIYNTFLTPLYRYVLSRCGDVNLTEDICQSSFLRFYEALPRYENTKSPLAYLFTIARNLIINEYKKLKPDYTDNEEDFFIENEVDFVEEINTKINFDQIMILVKELSSNEQDVINLIYLSEFEIKEVASILEQSEDWVRQVKHRALKKLQIKANKFYDK